MPAVCLHFALQSAIDRGWFQADKAATHGRGKPALRVVLHTAQTLAAAMAYLHSRDIIHGVPAILAALAIRCCLEIASGRSASHDCC